MSSAGRPAAALRGAHCLVTGVAGFIGSHLAERLLAEGCVVTGVDAFTDYYARNLKEANLTGLLGQTNFRLLEADLAEVEAAPLLDGVDYVFHQAGQPGVRASWGSTFDDYLRQNVLVTQRLLEAAAGSTGLRRFVYASSSSVYGNAARLPVSEFALPRPVSPYGVTKLAGEHLSWLYATNFGVPTASLRYFTVYGPRQRPDMAFSKFIKATLDGTPITIYGDGAQTRDFTFISDAVDANLRAATEAVPAGARFNIGGGARVTVTGVIELLQEVAGRRVEVVRRPAQPGDARHTFANTGAARRTLGFTARVGLAEGLAAQLDWARHGRTAASGQPT